MISRVHFFAKYRTVWLTVHDSCMVTSVKPMRYLYFSI